MKTNNELRERIRTEWFKNHKATVTGLHSDGSKDHVILLDWHEPGTCVYSVRYIFSGTELFVSGDLGSAVFYLTERATPKAVAGYDLGYFAGKLRCCSAGDRGIEFSAEEAMSAIYAQFGNPDEASQETGELLDALKDVADNCESRQLWAYSLDGMSRALSNVDADWWEWMPNCGNIYAPQLVAWLEGLKMAYAQIREN